MTKKFNFANICLVLGLIFLYAPMVLLVIYSFNAGRLVTVWSGFSSQWYGLLLQDTQILNALWTSAIIAFWSATIAVVLGTMVALVTVRFQFRSRTFFTGMVTAPLVMPDVIIGISMLLLFVTLAKNFGWPLERGKMVIAIAHITFCTSYASVVISSRLREVNRVLEEAAMDLGASPLYTFFSITLPMILPSLAAAWLLACTLSLDDLVIASFVAGPGSTTLPMEIFSSARLGVSPKINALASLIILAVSALTFIAWFFIRRALRQEQAISQALKSSLTKAS